MAWQIEYYQSANGRYPVAEFIDSLDIKSKAKVARTLDLLEQFGNDLGMPYAKYLEEQLWEIRTRHGRNRYRIICFLARGRTFILLHGITKKSGTVPRRNIETAKSRRDDYLSRER